MTDQQRYQRQLILKGFGHSAQQKLSAAAVLVIGAGGLGCAVLQYLTAAGIGKLGIVDNDRIQLSNLQRQILYGEADIGRFKTEVAKERLQELNDRVGIEIWTTWLDNKLCLEIFDEFDLIIDATDNFASRYRINDACVLINKPFIFGAVSGFEGQIAVFSRRNYRDLFPVPPLSFEVANCEEGGVLGVLPGTIGVFQATEAIKWITGLGNCLIDRMLTYSALTQSVYTFSIAENPEAQQYIPNTADAFLQSNYEFLCGSVKHNVKEISRKTFMMERNRYTVIDVREVQEVSGNSGYVNLPLSELKTNSVNWETITPLFVCQSGTRSLKAALLLADKFPHITFYSLQGGIVNLEN